MRKPRTADRSRTHRVLRQTLELAVASGAQAREIHAELSAEYAGRLAAALEGLFDAACDRDATLRIDRVVLDVGVLPCDGLPQSLAVRVRERLETVLLPGAGKEGGAPVEVPVRRLSVWDVALERIIGFLATGALPARDPSAGSAQLETDLATLLEGAPHALAGALRGLPHGATARRLARHFSAASVRRVAALAGGVTDSDLELLLDDWLLVVRLPATRGTATGDTIAELGGFVEALLALLLLGRNLPDALCLLAEGFVAERGGNGRQAEQREPGGSGATSSARGSPGPLARLVDEVRCALPATSRVRQALERAVQRHTGGSAEDGVPPPLAGAPAIRSETEARASGAKLGAPAATLREGTSDSDEPALRPVEDFAVPGGERSHAAQRDSGRDRQRLGARDALWVEHAGLAILWPFLPGFFGALSLVAGRNFASEPARARAILLAAHLCDGASEWNEHDLLLEKILCGHPPFDPVETRIELGDAERAEARALLDAVVAHWSILKRTSVEGLRSAFLHRAGTLTAQAQGWKLEVARAAHDVLLDRLPWGFGMVLLPWMHEPLYVEW